MIPDQCRSVDPFSSYHSDNVNKLTRLLTAGDNLIVRSTHLVASIGTSPNLIQITDGVSIKDDVMIQVKEVNGNGYSVIDLTDPTNYIPSSVLPKPNILDLTPYPADTYIVLDYEYAKTSTPPEAALSILKNPSVDFDPERYVFIAMATFSSATVLLSITQDDVANSVYRILGNLTDAYTDTDARAADALNPITNHLPANGVGGYIKHGVVVTGTALDIPPGKIKVVPYSDVAGYRVNTKYTWTGTPINVVHGLGVFPQIQLLDDGSKEGVEGIVTNNTVNDFSVDFDFSAASPPVTSYDFWVIY